MPGWTKAALVLVLAAGAAGCLGADGGPADASSDSEPNSDAPGPHSSPEESWTRMRNETGTFEVGAGAGTWGVWDGDGARHRLRVPDGTGALSLTAVAPRYDASSPGAGHVVLYATEPNGTVVAPDEVVVAPADELPEASQPVVVAAPPAETLSLEVEEPDAGRWTVVVGPNGPVVETTYELQITMRGEA
jgi:hypothetical protein